jgi:hypothetical protein
LTRTLPRLPGQEDDNAPVTVDLHGPVAVRARAEGQGRQTEILLNDSEVVGPPLRWCVNRAYLLRALQLGFREVQIVSATVPVVCQDRQRTFAWMPLDHQGALAPSADALRLASPAGEPAVQQLAPAAETAPPPPPTRERRKAPMTKPSANGGTKTNGRDKLPEGNGVPPSAGNAGLASVIAEAQALKDVLREAYGRTSRLVVALQRYRKNSKLFQTALTSLRQLQHLDQ